MRPKDALDLEPWEEWCVIEGMNRRNEEMYGDGSPEKPKGNTLDLTAMAAMGAQVEQP